MKFIRLAVFTLLIISILSIKKTEAQKRLTPEGVKINLNYGKNFPNKGYTIGNLAPVFIMQNKRFNFHEIELNTFDSNTGERSIYDQNGSRIQVMDIRLFSMGLRYQFNWNIIKKDQGKIIPQLGVSFLSLYRSTTYDPQMNNAYKRKVREYHEYLGLAPQVRYNMSKRISMDLSFPLDFIHCELGLIRIYNPSIPTGNQKNGWSEIDFQDFNTLLKYSRIRLGVAVKF